MAESAIDTTVCFICGRLVSLETCKIDEQGRAIHEDCYVQRMKLDSASRTDGQSETA